VLRLPRLDVCRNEYSEASLLVAIRKQLQEDDAKRDNGIHASDLLDLRLAYWRNTNPKEVDERTAFFFVIGKVLHTLVLSLADPMITASDAGTKNELGISYSPDLVSRAGRPTELKSNRATDEPDDLQEEYSHYLEQLIIYMICENMLTGELWILYLNLREASSRRTFPALRCYTVSLTQEQFEGLEEQIVWSRDKLRQALQEHTPQILEPCRAWKCGKACAWWDECRPQGRWPKTDKRSWTG